MRPLTASSTSSLMERIENVKDGELRSIVMKDPTTFTLTFSVQDKNRGFDWLNIAFEISGIYDARLIDDKKLAFVDMSDGVSIVFEDSECGLLFGYYRSLDSAADSVIYMLGDSIKYEELPFSE